LGDWVHVLVRYEKVLAGSQYSNRCIGVPPCHPEFRRVILRLGEGSPDGMTYQT